MIIYYSIHFSMISSSSTQITLLDLQMMIHHIYYQRTITKGWVSDRNQINYFQFNDYGIIVDTYKCQLLLSFEEDQAIETNRFIINNLPSTKMFGLDFDDQLKCHFHIVKIQVGRCVKIVSSYSLVSPNKRFLQTSYLPDRQSNLQNPPL